MGSHVMPLPMYWELVDFIHAHQLTVETMITHRFALESASDAFRLFDEGCTGKVIFAWPE